MVYVVQNCICGLCIGNQPVNKQKPDDIVFGGSICNCPCHHLKGEERDKFIMTGKYLDSQASKISEMRGEK